MTTRFPTNTDILGFFLSDLPNSLIILSHVLIFLFCPIFEVKRGILQTHLVMKMMNLY